MANEVSKNLGKFIDELDPVYVKKAMSNACAKVQTNARQICPKDTGTLRRSIDFEVSEDGKDGVIFSNLEYAPYVEKGTGIYAAGGRQEPWRYEGSHGWVTTKGSKPQAFLEPAALKSKAEIEACFRGLF